MDLDGVSLSDTQPYPTWRYSPHEKCGWGLKVYPRSPHLVVEPGLRTFFMWGRVMLSPMVGTPGLALRCATLRICLWHHRMKPHSSCTFWTFNPECRSRNIALSRMGPERGNPTACLIHTYFSLLTRFVLFNTHTPDILQDTSPGHTGFLLLWKPLAYGWSLLGPHNVATKSSGSFSHWKSWLLTEEKWWDNLKAFPVQNVAYLSLWPCPNTHSHL